MPLAIAKTLLPDTATFYLALGRVFGIGKATGLAIAEEVGISREARVMDVKPAHVRRVRVPLCLFLVCWHVACVWCVWCVLCVQRPSTQHTNLRPQHNHPPPKKTPKPKVVAILNERYKIGDELKRSIRDDILRLIEAGTYRGKRHELGLPVRGQRTHTNAQTARKFKRHVLYDVR
jgi:small subunit ribosomal protein S13